MSTSNFRPIPAEEVAKSSDGLIHGVSAAELQVLGSECNDAKATAYCPYSLFRVGASLLIRSPSPSGAEHHIVSGANVENASYPVGTCAERTAMGTAVLQGHKIGSYKAIGVSTDMDDFCSPCGMCRQFLREFCEDSVPIFMFNKKGEFKVKTMGELLPLSFGPSSLPSRDQLKGIVEDGKDKKA
ncbi:cytidine deaminase [Aaosphaeria arxii CBS 175.79]|uniref:Cytidine deaminase n=1 Tax=Aaosphaeria arxii CBS 175.79 TaxID=1450172 RepID=A0A6A5XA38_9PLEO|nr:cytidine deaminase [Aaosphaeria arxii CBS 175.79]KAF2009803.1 cytidine deaminase [Aaosphaeria arxii CBS 175.79]